MLISIIQSVKKLKYPVGLLAFVAISPIVLAKLGFWGSSFAQSPHFKPPYPPIQYAAGAPQSYAPAVQRAAPSVVSIQSTRKAEAVPDEVAQIMQDPLLQQFFGNDPRIRRKQQQENIPSIGSGVIVSTEGHILTNSHVIKGASDLQVKLPDGRKVTAKVIGSDPDSDVAILQIKIDKLPPPIALGDSDALRPGDVVLAIGSPFGLGNTVSMGIVSATHRNDLGITAFENYIQTDAAINPGNSGGPLIDANGNMVGINNVICTRSGGSQGIGFAIPIKLAKDLMAELINAGHITRGWLGISVRKLTDELRVPLKYPKGEGVVVGGIMREGPAHVAGIQPGDIIISLDNKPTKDPSEVLGIAARLKPNQAANIAVVRGGQIYDFRIIMGKRPAHPSESK